MLSNRELKNLKSRLTRAKNSGDPNKVIDECNRTLKIFEEKGYPDCWNIWVIAFNDATFKNRSFV